jgi:hypothetical protein
MLLFRNKPAAQAAGADPSRCHSTNRQNQPLLQPYILNHEWDFDALQDLKIS